MTMSSHRTAVTTRKDTMVTTNTNGISSSTPSRTSQHVQAAIEFEAERQLQALDEGSDSTSDNVSDLLVHRDTANVVSQQQTCASSYARTTRRPNGTTVFNVVDVEELSPWSTALGRFAGDQLQRLSHSGKTNRIRLNAEVITAYSFCC